MKQIVSTIKVVVTVFFLVLSVMAHSQCNVTNYAFAAGEEIVYDAVYNWGFIWVEAGKVTFTVTDEKYNGKNVYKLASTGISLPKYDWFFKVRDYFYSYVDIKTLSPYKYVRNTSERNYKVDNTFWFDYKKKKIYTESDNSEKEFEKDTFDLNQCTFDLMTAVYYVRNINFNNHKINEKIPLHLIVDNELVDLFVRNRGVEVLETNDGNAYSCLKISASLMKGTIFKGGEDVTIWITDDKNKVPVLVQAEILVGTVKAVLVSTKGLRNSPNVFDKK